MSESKATRNRFSLYVIAALLLLLLVVYAWKSVEILELKHRLEEQRVQLDEAMRQALAEQQKQTLLLASVPLGWAVRRELMNDDLTEIDDYFRRLVKEKRVTRIALVGPDGNVLVASDKKLEEQPASSFFPTNLLDVTDARVEETADGGFQLTVPIMGLDTRLGVLVMEYSAPSFSDSE